VSQIIFADAKKIRRGRHAADFVQEFFAHAVADEVLNLASARLSLRFRICILTNEMNSKRFSFAAPLAVVCILLFAISCAVAADSQLLPPGFRPLPLGVHALVGGKIVVRPGEVLDGGVIVIRDGFIKAVGTNVIPPADARVWDMHGTTIYAGFIDPYLTFGATNPPVATSDTMSIGANSLTSGGVKFFGAPGAQTDMGKPGPGYEISRITPEQRAVQSWSPKDKELSPLRELGFTAGLIAPSHGIIRGTSAFVALTEENPNTVVIKPDVFQHVAFETVDSDDAGYPASLMGVIATVRQTFFDAQHYTALARQSGAATARPTQNRREFNPSLEALAPAVNKTMPVMFEPGSALMDDRAARMAHELGLDNFCIVSCGQEWRRPDLLKVVGQASSLPVGSTNAGKMPAPLTFIVPVNFPTLPKLPSDDDWQQITLDQLRAWDWAAENPALLRQQGLTVALTTYGLGDKKDFRKNLRLALDRGLSEDDALAALTTVPAKLCGVENLLGTIEPGKIANLTVVDGKGYFDADAKVREVWIDGRIYRSPADVSKSDKSEAKVSKAETTNPKEEPEKNPKPPVLVIKEQNAAKSGGTNQVESKTSEEKKSDAKDKKKDEIRELQKTRVAHSPLEGRGAITNPPAILISGATVWTCSSQGILTNANLLVSGDGKIISVGRRWEVNGWPPMFIEGHGLTITPGIIDCHSHSAILGNVNEIGLPSTAMVRIGDVVNSETPNLYEQLAGGVTTINLLHGSANPIGGQNQVIKLRDGASPEDLKFADAPQGIKFALGENVKQSNWGDNYNKRFPQTRMGVQTFIANRFVAAQEYLRVGQASRLSPSQTNSETGATPVLPRRDLELEALGEVLQGTRWIHCHSYRQDEMLMLLRLMQGFGVKIGSFQHGLEGYKIADELAAGGVGLSSFADWWAFKFEVYDAIPYNGSLLRDRGVLVSFNSDSSDLARRLYLEAAKAVKYGGTPEAEALKFVTLNPAKQLRIDSHVGSLEPGKDADFVLWSKSPLDSGTVCLQTWIDGKKYFDRSLDAARTARLKKERDDLIAKAKKLVEVGGGGGGSGGGDDNSFFRVSLEHQFDGVDRGCLDEAEGER
jgi:imidazolonepropionase-like amidohydrolase